MQAMSAKALELPPETILRMATLHGAEALGRRGQVGELAENALADLIAVPFAGSPARPFEAIIQHQGPVAASMIGGVWAVPPSSN
jgi:cytosine/adenosine deaminase-related metal-dependent hydrolase